MKLGIRISQALDHANMRGSELAKAIGTKPSTVSDWVTGRTKKISGQLGMAAAVKMGVSPQWLINGKGGMLDGVTTQSEKQFIFDCLNYLVKLEPDIEPSRLLTVGSMLYNSCKAQMRVDRSEAVKLLSIVD